MADRSFEEQVRAQLSGMQLTPDGEVWVEIDKELRKENKRRGFIWFFFFGALIAVGAIGTHLWYQPASPVVSLASSRKPVNAPKIAYPAPDSQPLPAAGSGDRLSQNKLPRRGLASVVPGEVVKANREIKQPTTIVTDGNSSRKKQEEDRLPFYKKIPGIIPATNTGEVAVKENSADQINNLAAAERPTGLSTGDTPAMENKPLKKQDSILSSVVNQVKTTDENSSPQTASKEKRALKKWQWYLSLDAGKSLAESNLFVSPSAVFSSATLNNNNFAVIAYPSARREKTGSAFSFGLSAEVRKELSKRWAIGFSLGYQYYGSRIPLGKRVDTLAGLQGAANTSYYQTANYITYTNEYHFLLTGVSFYRTFHVGKSFMFRWQLGGALNTLLTTSAAQYEPTTGLWTKNRAFFYTIEANLSSGLEIGIGKNPLFFAGPQFNYFFTPVTHLGNTSDPIHLLRSGIKVSMLLPSGKKQK